MIEKKKILALIPARGGSKGVPRKNIRSVAGKPLIAWILEAAKQSRYIDRLVVSSDDKEIIETAIHYGAEAPFVRPKELAQDESADIDVLLHAIQELPGYDYLLELQATSPLCTVSDIDAAIEQMHQSQADAVVSVTEPQQSPYWMFSLDSSKKMKPVLSQEKKYSRRQDLPPVYSLNGAISIARIPFLKSNKSFLSDTTLGYVMPKERSLDIDTLIDLELCDKMLRNN